MTPQPPPTYGAQPPTQTIAVQPGRVRWLLTELRAAGVDVLDYAPLPDGQIGVTVPGNAPMAPGIGQQVNSYQRKPRDRFLWDSGGPLRFVPRVLAFAAILAIIGGVVWGALQTLTVGAAMGAPVLLWAGGAIVAIILVRLAFNAKLRALNESSIETQGYGAVNGAYSRLGLQFAVAFAIMLVGIIVAGLALGVFEMK